MDGCISQWRRQHGTREWTTLSTAAGIVSAISSAVPWTDKDTSLWVETKKAWNLDYSLRCLFFSSMNFQTDDRLFLSRVGNLVHRGVLQYSFPVRCFFRIEHRPLTKPWYLRVHHYHGVVPLCVAAIWAKCFTFSVLVVPFSLLTLSSLQVQGIQCCCGAVEMLAVWKLHTSILLIFEKKKLLSCFPVASMNVLPKNVSLFKFCFSCAHQTEVFGDMLECHTLGTTIKFVTPLHSSLIWSWSASSEGTTVCVI